MSEKNQWKPIESAPKTGRTLLLGYWNSHGKWRTVRGQWMSAEYIGQEWEEPDDVEAGWFETAVEADDVPNCWPVNPSHWQPMPAAPCPTCNDQGTVGNILTAEPCPACTPAAAGPGDVQDAARWRWLSAQFDNLTTSESVLFLEMLYLNPDKACSPLGATVDAALAAQVPQQGEA
ncbi:hypothetical protein ACFWP0_09315 [Achromobacter sp. NPDC058515]|uniref:hypothetical protein n=1 Tax=Achromobacter sp. NPDC058515 TaxID=3346533 RepID=UPI0036618AC2